MMEGISLRKYQLDDAAKLVSQADNPRIAAFLRDSMPQPYTFDDADRWVRFNLVNGDGPDTINRVIALDDDLIGTIGIRRGEDIHRFNAEIGYWLGEEHWGKGIATRAVELLSEWIFHFTDIHRLYAGVMEPNSASAKVLEKAGYSLECVIRDGVFKNGRFVNELLYSRRRNVELQPLR